MAGVNKVIIIGNLGRDPELKYTQSGTAVCRLNIATTRSWTNKETQEKKEETEWHRVTVWGKTAEHCNNYLAKGRSVYVEGRLKTTSYDKDGEKRYSTDIVGETVQFLGGNPNANNNSGGGDAQGPSGGSGTRARGSDGRFGGGSGGPPPGPPGPPPGPEDDDIPF